MDNSSPTGIQEPGFLFENDGQTTDVFRQKLVDFFPALIYVYDTDKKKLSYVNKKLNELLGYSADDLQDWDNDLLPLIFKDDVGSVKKELEKFNGLAVETDSHAFHCRFNHKNGDWRYFQVQGMVLNRDEAGKPKSILFVAQDATGTYKSQDEIRDLQAFKTAQLEKESLLDFGTWEASEDKNSFIGSDGLLRLYGYDPARKAQYNINEAFFTKHVSAEDLGKIKQASQDARASNDVYVVEFGITSNSGEEKRLETFGKIIRNEQGEAVKTYGTTRDITQLKNYEQSLEAKVQELNRSNKDLEEFAYVASHDLQEPLRKLTTFCERLASKYAAELSSDMRQYVERIVSSADNMRTLIDNLLEFSRVARAARLYEPADLNAILQEVKQDLDLRIEETHTSIILNRPLPRIEGIPSQLKQLFTNLISNSIKFRTQNTPTVIHIDTSIASKEDKEACNLPAAKAYHRIEVRDNGIGFEQEYAERIFQIFQRLHGKVEYPGSGVGLAICRKIAENHHGKIFARSEPGKGASFIILLPK